MAAAGPSRPRRRWRRRLLLLAGLVLLLWPGGDLLYSRIVAHRLARWEATVPRDPAGVREGCQPVTLEGGTGALLLVHGFGDCPAVFGTMAPALAGRGFTCRVMRLPGFAMPMEVYAGTSLEQWLESFAGELEALRASHDQVTVVAHSLGASIAIHHLLEHPQDADGLVLLAPLLGVSGERSPLLAPRTWYEISGVLLIFTRVTETPFSIDARDPAAWTYPYRDRFVPRTVYDGLFTLLDRLEGRAGALQVPLLTVLPEQDAVIDLDLARAFHHEAGSRRKRLLVLPDTGHAVPLDRGWERVVEEIAAFVTTLPGAQDR